MLKQRKTEFQTIELELLGEDGEEISIAANFEEEASILDTILDTGVEISHSCGGMGSCGTCRVEVINGLEILEGRNEIEAEMAESREFKDHERLACQNKACVGLKVRIP